MLRELYVLFSDAKNTRFLPGVLVLLLLNSREESSVTQAS